MAPLSVWSQFSPVATCGKKKNKKKPSPQKAHRASLQKRHLWKGWHETSYNRKVWLWLFLFWVFDPQRFNICKSFLKPRESNLNRWQCKANGPRRKLWAGPAGETLLSIFSGLLHNQDSPLWLDTDNMNYIDTDHIGAADAKPINSHAKWNDEVVFSTIRC